MEDLFEFHCPPRFMLHIVYQLSLETTLLFAEVNVSNFLPKWMFLKYWISTVAGKVLFCPRASCLLQAARKHASGISQFPFDFIPLNVVFHSVLVLYSHPCLIANCFSLTDKNQYSANVIKPGAWVLPCPTAKMPFSSHSVSFGFLCHGIKWVEISKGYLRRYVIEISIEGKKSGIIVSLWGLTPEGFCPHTLWIY